MLMSEKKFQGLSFTTPKKSCDKCKQEFDKKNITLWHGQSYCRECLSEIKRNELKANEQLRKNKEEASPLSDHSLSNHPVRTTQAIDLHSQNTVVMTGEFSALQQQLQALQALQISSQQQIAHLQAEIQIMQNSNATPSFTKDRVEKIVMSFTWRRLVDTIKKKYGWETYAIRDFYDKKKKGLGFKEIIEQTKSTIDAKEIPKMERWAMLFNRYARDGEPTHNEEIEAIMEILTELLNVN